MLNYENYRTLIDPIEAAYTGEQLRTALLTAIQAIENEHYDKFWNRSQENNNENQGG